MDGCLLESMKFELGKDGFGLGVRVGCCFSESGISLVTFGFGGGLRVAQFFFGFLLRGILWKNAINK